MVKAPSKHSTVGQPNRLDQWTFQGKLSPCRGLPPHMQCTQYDLFYTSTGAEVSTSALGELEDLRIKCEDDGVQLFPGKDCRWTRKPPADPHV